MTEEEKIADAYGRGVAEGRAHERAILDAARRANSKAAHRHAKMADECARLMQRYVALLDEASPAATGGEK